MEAAELHPLPTGLALALQADDLAAWPLMAAGCGPTMFAWTDANGRVQARSLLALACYYGASECVSTLLALPGGALAASEPSPSDGATPIHCACARPCEATYKILTSLIAAGADCAATDGSGRQAGELLIQSKVGGRKLGVLSGGVASIRRPGPRLARLLRLVASALTPSSPPPSAASNETDAHGRRGGLPALTTGVSFRRVSDVPLQGRFL